MDSVFVTATFARDAGVALTGTYLQRVAAANTGFMSAPKRVNFSPTLPFIINLAIYIVKLISAARKHRYCPAGQCKPLKYH